MKVKYQPESTDCKHDSKVVEISPELCISKSSFLLLVNCVLGYEAIPVRKSAQFDELVETMIKLGGCKAIEPYIENIEDDKDTSYCPFHPTEDVEGRYSWQILTGHTFGALRYSDAIGMMSQGYELAIVRKQHCCYQDFVYRKKNS